MISAKRIAFSGATSDGLSTIVQPAASAGATLQAIWFSGQFQGVIIPHTPMGSRTISVVPIGRSNSKSASTPRAVARCAEAGGGLRGLRQPQRRARLPG